MYLLISNGAVEKRLQATEMWLFWRMQKIQWTAKRISESVLMEVNKKATFMNKIRTQQARFIGHVMRRYSLEHLIRTAKIELKRTELEEDRGRTL